MAFYRAVSTITHAPQALAAAIGWAGIRVSPSRLSGHARNTMRSLAR